jgi:hypothetical protein
MIALPNRERRFMQLCWSVPDLDAAMASWTRTAGVGPFFYFDTVPFEASHYRGVPCDRVDLRAAIAQAGDVQIELMQQRDDKPSFVYDVVPRGKTGLHHLALYCKDFDAELAAYKAAGVAVTFNMMMMGARTYYLDTTATLGYMVELIEANPIADQIFGAFRAAAENWDGKDPVRTLG